MSASASPGAAAAGGDSCPEAPSRIRPVASGGCHVPDSASAVSPPLSPHTTCASCALGTSSASRALASAQRKSHVSSACIAAAVRKDSMRERRRRRQVTGGWTCLCQPAGPQVGTKPNCAPV
eukprot:scaffold5365_cov115-Isochrysis_galbana.AAC.7